MIKCDLGPVNPAFCTFEGPEGWRRYLPEDLQHHAESYWRAKASRGDFAPFMKLSFRGTAYFKKSDVLQHFILLFEELRPDSVAALRAAGYELAKPVTTTRKPKTRKPGNTQHHQHRKMVNDLLKPKRTKTGDGDAV